MRQIFKFLPVAAAIALIGCNDDFHSEYDSATPGLPIVLKASYPTASRATDGGFEHGDCMGLYVLDYTDDTPEDINDAPHAANVRFEFDEASNTCKGVTSLYWTDANTPADLVSYYPFVTTVDDPKAMEVAVSRRQDTEGTETTMGGYEASDFLYAKAHKVMPTSQTVNLTFAHAFAGIRVTLLPGTGFDVDQWNKLEKNVTITNMVVTGKINLSDGSVTVDETSPTSIVPLKYGEDFRAVAIPQTVSSSTKILGISVDGQGYDFMRDKATTFSAGKMHSFTITVNKKTDGTFEFKLTSEGITPWIDSVDFRDGLMRQYIVVDVAEAGGLEKAINQNGLTPSRITNLKLSGHLNERDYEYIRATMKSLKAINLYDTKNECFIDSGGGHKGIEKDYLPGGGLRNMEMTTHVVLPKYTKVIGGEFLRNSGLIGDVIIPEGVEQIGWGCFMECGSILGLSLPSTLKEIGGSAFEYSGLCGELNLPAGLVAIGGSAFHACKLSGELNFPASLRDIYENAFRDCKFTGSLVFPQGIKKVPEGCFSGVGFTGVLVLPEGLEEIGKNAFDGCGFRGELKLPSTLKSIDYRAFRRTLFSSVIFPDNLGLIAEGAFSLCSRLSGTLRIPDKLTVIPDEAFAQCTLLDEIVFPKNMARINGGAFAECYNLSSVTCLAEEPPTLKTGYIEDNLGRPYYPFHNVPRDNFTVQVPGKSVEAYKSAAGWSEFKRIAAYSNFVCRPAIACALNSVHTEEDMVLNADGPWEITHKPDWITLSKTSGTGKTQFSLTFSPLAKGAGDREDYVEFKLIGDEEVTTRCEVTQKDYTYDENQCLSLQKATKGRGIDVVFVGEGFDAEAIASGKYLDQVNDQIKAFFGVEPYASYRDYFNVKVCFPLSQETGVNTANTWRNTKFGVYYAPPSTCSSGLIDCYDPDAVFDYVSQKASISPSDMWRTLVVMALNSDEYGSNSVISGSGASIAIVGRSSDPYPMDSRGLMQREACGIAFGKLASERANQMLYLTKQERAILSENNRRGWYMNLSLNGDLHSVWWSDFIFDPIYSDKVDVYEGGLGKARGCFRSEINSCMNFGIPYFSLAARYDIVKRIMDYAGEEFTVAKFRELDSDRWGNATGSRAYGDFMQPTISYSNQPRFYKSRKY